MKKARLLFIAFMCFAFVSRAVALEKKPLTIQKNRSDSSVDVTIIAEIARSESQKEQGYKFRKNIKAGTGMLFVYNKDEIMRFWMKDTPSPLSIAFIDSRGKIRDIFDMKPFSEREIVSSVSCRYALEVPRGYFDTVDIKVGDTLLLDTF